MKKRKKSDPVVSEIERALDLGQFISYNRSWDFVRELEDSKKKIDALVKNGEAERAVGLDLVDLGFVGFGVGIWGQGFGVKP